MKNIISETKNTLEGITSRLDEAEDGISDLEHKAEIAQADHQHEKRLKSMRIA